MDVKVFIPRDTTALAMGADDVVKALKFQSKQNINIIRNGSRGLFYLEPLLELATSNGRVAFGPVEVDDVESLIAHGLLEHNIDKLQNHPLYLGLTKDIPYLAKQDRLTFARAGIIDPINLDDYLSLDGFKGLEKALNLNNQQIVDEVKASGLRGRGGAAFPTGIKWQTVLDAPASQKYIVCNADEGDSGTFADRLIMEADPFVLIEGMIIAGLAVNATQGYIYLRSEYPQAKIILEQAIKIAYDKNYLGKHICTSNNHFDLEVRIGAGAYICGEETSLLESLEGKRGLVRSKPPLPAIEGFLGQPTIVNNVISLTSVPIIFTKGAQYYENYGMGRSRGTLPVQLAGNIKQGGLVELGFGASLDTLINEFGGGTYSGQPMKAIQVGGPLGAYLPKTQWHTQLDYEAFKDIDAVLGHGGVVVFDDTADMAQQARFAMEFCAVESCGKCTPCRIGSVRGVEVIDKIINHDNQKMNLELLNDLCDTMELGSLCAMGGMTPFPVRSVIEHFGSDLVKPSLAKGEK
ncbi:formate dehydrogenase beta subunit [Pseudoalteromonas denitrificans]|uniref:NADH-quinone oxidoreductase subunit F n=1 Tax=Pseudoalteromonas denitrificans DSM 6059 TaxID=1123010 RepID=A0A1I1L838_9GAMM|nr:formate dehydrogenase beta subunit [Pseudoalteromonas denitrificans]SFC69274.1 formate dehydrogenase beta subunit [Pseudoalteromonas denitrificans DSM 6059]